MPAAHDGATRSRGSTVASFMSTAEKRRHVMTEKPSTPARRSYRRRSIRGRRTEDRAHARTGPSPRRRGPGALVRRTPHGLRASGSSPASRDWNETQPSLKCGTAGLGVAT